MNRQPCSAIRSMTIASPCLPPHLEMLMMFIQSFHPFGTHRLSGAALNQCHENKNQKNREQNLCDSCRGSGDAAETEDTGDEGHDQKDYCPLQHDVFVCVNFSSRKEAFKTSACTFAMCVPSRVLSKLPEKSTLRQKQTDSAIAWCIEGIE